MSAMWVIYFAEIADSLKHGTGGLCALLGLLGVVLLPLGLMMIPDFFPDDTANAYRLWKRASAAATAGFTLCGVIYVFTPSEKTIYMMAAAKVGQDIVTSPETKDVSSKVLKLINQKLDEQLSKPAEKK